MQRQITLFHFKISSRLMYIIVFSEFYNLTDVRHKEKSNRHDRQTDSGQTRTNLNQNDPSSLMTNVQCPFFIVKPYIFFTYLLWPVVKPCIVFTYFGHKTINNYFYLVLLNFVLCMIQPFIYCSLKNTCSLIT